MFQKLQSIGHYSRRALYLHMAWMIIALFTLNACAGERRPPPTAAPPIIMIPVTRTSATPTVAPTPVASTDSAADATPVEQSNNEPMFDLATYTLPEVGIALDFPATWAVVDVSPEIRAQSSAYAITFLAERAEEGAPQSVPENESENETKFDLVIMKNSVTSAEEAATQRKEQLAQDPTSATVLSEAALTLPSGLEVIRLELEGRFGPALEYITAVSGHTVFISGLGNFESIEVIANTLRLVE